MERRRQKGGQKGKGSKGRTSIGGNPVSFFKEVNLTYYPLSFASFLNLDFASISSTSVFSSSPCLLLLSLSLSLSLSVHRGSYRTVGYKISRVRGG